jgi:hypothetical protein
LLDLLGTALCRSLAILGSHGIRIDQLLREGRFGEHDHGNQTRPPKRFHGNVLKAFSSEADAGLGSENALKQKASVSEKARTEIQSVGRKQERHGQADGAKHDNGLERFDVNPCSGYARKNPCESSHLRSPG